MKRLGLVIVFVVPLSLLASGSALAADDSKVKAATEQVERGAKKIPDGKIGEKLKEAGKAAEPPAKTAWGNARDEGLTAPSPGVRASRRRRLIRAVNRSCGQSALTPFVLPRILRHRHRKAIVVAPEHGRLADRTPLENLPRPVEYPRPRRRPAAEAGGSANRHTLEERAHRRVRVGTVGIDQRSANAALTLDPVDDRHVVRI